jgi:Carboxypeptidase regulatory-like domain
MSSRTSQRFGALFACIVILPATAGAQDAAINGIVHDTTTGAPLSGVRISLEPPTPPKSAITADDGTYRFDNLSPGTYRLRCALDGYDMPFGASTISVRLTGGVEERVRINLTPISTIEGVVRDEDGVPVPGVNIYTAASLRATTGEDGRYTITHLNPGNHQLVVHIPHEFRRKTLVYNPDTGETLGYAAAEYYPGTAEFGSAVTIPLLGSLHLHGFDIRLRRVPLVTFSGRILERAGGKAIAGGQVALEPPGANFIDESTTRRAVDADGAFRFDLLMPGRYSLEVYRQAGETALPYRAPIELGKTGIEGMTVPVPPFPVIEGVIRTNDDRAWSGRAQIILLRSARSPSVVRETVATSERFNLGEVPPGNWRIAVQAEVTRADQQALFPARVLFGGQDALAREITVTESGNPLLEIHLSAETGRVAGMVIDADGKPLSRVLVVLHPEGESLIAIRPNMAFTKDDGSFSFDRIPPGRYQVVASGSSQTYDRPTVEVRAGETVLVQLRPGKR